MFSNFFTMLYTGSTQFSTLFGVNLWKTIKKDVLNAQINNSLLSILFHKGVNKGGVICGINVSQCCYLSEHYITISLKLQPPR